MEPLDILDNLVQQSFSKEDVIMVFKTVDPFNFSDGLWVFGAGKEAADGFYKTMKAEDGPPTKFLWASPTTREQDWKEMTDGHKWYLQEGPREDAKKHWIRFDHQKNGDHVWYLDGPKLGGSKLYKVTSKESSPPVNGWKVYAARAKGKGADSWIKVETRGSEDVAPSMHRV